MAALRAETVERNRWLGSTQVWPGLRAVPIHAGNEYARIFHRAGLAFARYAGRHDVALVASSLPCSIVTVAITLGIEASRGNRWAMLAIDGAAASTVGIVAASCWHLMRPHIGSGELVRTIALVVGAALLQLADVAPVRILLIAAIIGALWREPR